MDQPHARAGQIRPILDFHRVARADDDDQRATADDPLVGKGVPVGLYQVVYV